MKCFLSIIYKYAHKRMIQTGIFFNGFKDRRMKLIQRVLPFLILRSVAGGRAARCSPDTVQYHASTSQCPTEREEAR